MHVFPYVPGTGKRAKPFMVTCIKCEGEGSYDTQHPMWGSRDCPEAYVQVKCTNCSGDGEVRFSEGEFRDEIAEIVNEFGDDNAECAERILQHVRALGLVPSMKRGPINFAAE